MVTITKRLLDAEIGNGKLRIIRDDEQVGFGVQVTPAGAISFCVTYTVKGKSKRTVFGRYGRMTIDQARKRARELLTKADAGEEVVAKEKPASGLTVADIFKSWMDEHVAKQCKPRSVEGYRQSFETHIRPRFGSMQAHELDQTHVARAHAGMAATPTAANHMIRTLRAMLSWASDRGRQLVQWPNGNPAAGHKLYNEKPADRMLTVPEIRTFITELPNTPMSAAMRRFLMLELLLGQRSGEIAGMRRSEVDLDRAVWTQPPEKNKGNRKHEVPLPPWSRQIIEEAVRATDGAFLFPSPALDDEGEEQPLASHAASTAMRRAQRPKGKDGKPARRTKDSTWVFDFRDREGGMSRISPHDLRRTCSSYLELLGHGDTVRGAILNHAPAGNVTAKHYSAADLLRLKRTALLQWEAAVRKIMAGDDPFAATIEDDRAEEERVLGELTS